MEEALRLPLLKEVLPGGLRFGANYLIEFEPQSLWQEASLTLVAQALKAGHKSDYHTFTHAPEDVRAALSRQGLDLGKLERDDIFRVWDSFTVQGGIEVSAKIGMANPRERVDLRSVKMTDWDKEQAEEVRAGFPQIDLERLHVDDNTSVLLQYNTEQEVINHFRTITLQHARKSRLAAVHSLISGIYSDNLYRQFESFCDGIIDFKSADEGGKLLHLMRVRLMRGRDHDSSWRVLELSGNGEVSMKDVVPGSGSANPVPDSRTPLEKLTTGAVPLSSGPSPGGIEPEKVWQASREQRERRGVDAADDRRLAAIMFTDMVGFTGMAQRDEALAMQLLEEQRRLMRPFFARHRGREVKTIGDAFLVEFSSALEAVKCAVEIQEALKGDNANRPPERKLVVRIGVHLGDVIHTGSDVAGDAVNVASRIEPLSPPGGVCVSGQVYESVINKVGVGFESMGTPQLKNVATSVSVYRVVGLGEKSVQAPPPKAGLPTERVAVLPFSNFSAVFDDEYFADGMTEELISCVSRTRGLRAIARTSVMKYKGAGKSIAEIGRELNVGSVLEGSVRKAGDKVRVTVQLVDTSNEEPRWSQEYDRELRDIFAIQSEIAQRVAEALRVHVLGAPAGGGGRLTPNTDAYVDYLRGRQAWNRRNEAGLKQAIGFFEKALAADGNYAMAHTGLADSYAALALLEFVAPKEAYPKAKEAVGKALALDPLLAEAHTSLGLIRFQYDWDWTGAEEEFREAIKLDPSYAPAHHYFADYLKAMGRFEEALSEIAKARELDPLNLAINAGVGHVLYLSRQYDRAIEQYQKTVELDPAFMLTHVWFGRPYLEKGMYAQALTELETGVRLSGEGTLALGMFGHGLASTGRKEEAEQVLEKLKGRAKTTYVPSYWIAVVYNGLKDRERALAWLERAFEERSSWLVWSNVEPRFDWLREDPKFGSLMKSMKFPQTDFNR